VKHPPAYGEPVHGTPMERYRLVELLGRGGTGDVWRAHDTATNPMVAIKLLLPQLAADHADDASCESPKNPPRHPQHAAKRVGIRSSQIRQAESRAQ
jgi:serine/threonine protein kinase